MKENKDIKEKMIDMLKSILASEHLKGTVEESNLKRLIQEATEKTETNQDSEKDLRDNFAGLAMQGFLAHYGNSGTWHTLSRMSYQVADAMLKARKGSKP